MQSSCPPPETSISVKKLIFKYKKSEFFCFTWINCTGEHLKRKGNTGRIPNLKNMPFRETIHYFMFWLLFVFVKKLFYTSVIFVNFKFRIPDSVNSRPSAACVCNKTVPEPPGRPPGRALRPSLWLWPSLWWWSASLSLSSLWWWWNCFRRFRRWRCRCDGPPAVKTIRSSCTRWTNSVKFHRKMRFSWSEIRRNEKRNFYLIGRGVPVGRASAASVAGSGLDDHFRLDNDLVRRGPRRWLFGDGRQRQVWSAQPARNVRDGRVSSSGASACASGRVYPHFARPAGPWVHPTGALHVRRRLRSGRGQTLLPVRRNHLRRRTH